MITDDAQMQPIGVNNKPIIRAVHSNGFAYNSSLAEALKQSVHLAASDGDEDSREVSTVNTNRLHQIFDSYRMNDSTVVKAMKYNKMAKKLESLIQVDE